MEFLNFTEFPHYVTAVYVVVTIGIVGICGYVLFNSQKQKNRLKQLEKKSEQ